MGTRKVKYIDIDGERLRQAITSRGMSLIEAGRKLGRSTAYFSHICTRDQIPDYLEPAIENVLGIALGEYLPTTPSVIEEDEDELEVVKVQLDIDYEQLQGAIYSAIMGAVRKLQREGFGWEDLA